MKKIAINGLRSNIGNFEKAKFHSNFYMLFLQCNQTSFHFSQQVVTLEGWSELMYFVQDAYNFWVWIYFVTLISVSDLSINSFMTEISII